MYDNHAEIVRMLKFMGANKEIGDSNRLTVSLIERTKAATNGGAQSLQVQAGAPSVQAGAPPGQAGASAPPRPPHPSELSERGLTMAAKQLKGIRKMGGFGVSPVDEGKELEDGACTGVAEHGFCNRLWR